jgi:hypothetical protein
MGPRRPLSVVASISRSQRAKLCSAGITTLLNSALLRRASRPKSATRDLGSTHRLLPRNQIRALLAASDHWGTGVEPLYPSWDSRQHRRDVGEAKSFPHLPGDDWGGGHHERKMTFIRRCSVSNERGSKREAASKTNGWRNVTGSSYDCTASDAHSNWFCWLCPCCSPSCCSSLVC